MVGRFGAPGLLTNPMFFGTWGLFFGAQIADNPSGR